MRRNKHFITFVCLILGAVMLTSAALANYGNANGYTAYKNGLLNLLSLDNYSGSAELKVMLDDYVIASMNYFEQMDKNGAVKLHTKESSTEFGSNDYLREEWTEDFPSSSLWKYKNYTRNTYLGSPQWDITGTDRIDGFGTMIDTSGYDDESVSKTLRVIELAADMLIGDLKNNFVYTGTENGNRNYQFVITKAQLPELISAAMDLLFDQGVGYSDSDEYVEYNPWYDSDRDEQYIEMQSIISNIKSMDFRDAKCFVTLDPDGNIVSNTLEGTVEIYTTDGKTHTLSMTVQGEMWDIGTTVIDAPIIGENETVYDYSMGTAVNSWTYKIIRNGVEVERTREDDDRLRELDWFNSLSAYDLYVTLSSVSAGYEVPIEIDNEDGTSTSVIQIAAMPESLGIVILDGKIIGIDVISVQDLLNEADLGEVARFRDYLLYACDVGAFDGYAKGLGLDRAHISLLITEAYAKFEEGKQLESINDVVSNALSNVYPIDIEVSNLIAEPSLQPPDLSIIDGNNQ